MKAVILAAGRGTRLEPLTRDIPKVMLPIAGRPLIEYTLALLRKHGIGDVGINLHHAGNRVTDHLGTGERFEIRIHYSYEQSLLGTAGALWGMRDYLSDEADFLVLYGDVLTDQNLDGLIALHRGRAADATLVVHRRSDGNSFISLGDDDRITSFIERPARPDGLRASHPWVNSGIHVFNREILDLIPPRIQSDLPSDVFAPHFEHRRFFAMPLDGFRCAIDSPDRLAQAERDVLSGRLLDLRTTD